MAQHRQLRSLGVGLASSSDSTVRDDSSAGLHPRGALADARDVPLRLTRRVSGRPRLLGLDSRLRRPA